MEVSIIGVEGKGNLDKEVVWLDILEDTDIGYYLLSDTTYTDEKTISNELRHVYWFPSRNLKKSDYVALYTKNGTNYTTSNKRGSKSHIYYWNLGKTIWNKDGDCAVLFKIETWTTKRA